MKLNNIFISLFAVSTLLSACSYQSNSSNYTPKFGQSQPNAQSSTQNLHWSGKYDGLLPCTDCIGIKTELRLNPDFTYILRETSLGNTTQTNLYQGEFKFSDFNNKIIVLDDKAEQRQYWLGKDYIEARNSDGSEVTTVLKPHYKMQRISN